MIIANDMVTRITLDHAEGNVVNKVTVGTQIR